MRASALLCVVVLAASARADDQPVLAVRTVNARRFPPRVAPLPEARWNSAVALHEGKILLFGGQKDGRWSREVRALDLDTGEWTRLADMPDPKLSGYAEKTADGRFVIPSVDGGSGRTALYDPVENSWSDGPAFTAARGSTHLVAAGGAVYALEGEDGNGDGVPVVERLEGDLWRPVGRSPQVAAGATAALDGKIYLLGGWDGRHGSGQTDLNDAYAYDLASRRWTRLPPMFRVRYGAAAVGYDGKIFVVGGADRPNGPGLRVAEVYDPATRTWSALPDMPVGVRNPGFVAARGRLIAFGGSPQGGSAVDAVQVFDPSTRRWTLSTNGVRAAPPAPAAPSVAISPSRPADDFPRRAAERPHDYALVIGVGGYKNLPQAEFAEDDARAMSIAFRSLGVPEENVVTLTGAKAGYAEVVKYAEEWLPRHATADSRVYFYFSGHGAPDLKDGAAYLMPWDGDAAFVKSTGVPLERVYKALGALPAARVLAIVDACFSGAGGRSVLVAGARPLVAVKVPEAPRGKISVLTAAESEQIAGASDTGRHGLFTNYLIQGLGGGAGDDAHLTLEQLYAFARKRTILDARQDGREQTPTMSSPDPKMRLY